MLEQIHRVGTVGIDPETIIGTTVPLVIDVIPEECEELPGAFESLLNLLQTLINVGVMFGIVLAVGGIIVSGILFLMPGVERNRQARTVFKYTLLGLIVVMVGPSVVGFIVGELNPLCG
jgi:hypothetical protein